MPLTNDQASTELFDQYKTWKVGTTRVSNGPRGASEISRNTANYLRGRWNPNSKPNSWDQSLGTAFTTKDDISRWVTLSVSGGGSVVDFHAKWKNVTFLWHFKVVDG